MAAVVSSPQGLHWASWAAHWAAHQNFTHLWAAPLIKLKAADVES